MHVRVVTPQVLQNCLGRVSGTTLSIGQAALLETGNRYRCQIVQARMRRRLRVGSILVSGLVLAACGPGQVGSGTPDPSVGSANGAATTLAISMADITTPPSAAGVDGVETTSIPPVLSTVANSVPTTIGAATLDEQQPQTLPAVTAASDASVVALANAMGIEGELEHRDGEHGPAQCIGRLEPRGVCVNVPLWGVWQYWDLVAQDGPAATTEEAERVAVELFAQLGTDPGTIVELPTPVSVVPDGRLASVMFSSGTEVRVAQGGRIAMILAATDLLPTA